MTNTNTQYAEIKAQLEKIQAEMRQKRIDAFRMAIAGIRAKRFKHASDVLLSNAYDTFAEMLQSPVCLTEDIDSLLELADTMLDLEKICLSMDSGNGEIVF